MITFSWKRKDTYGKNIKPWYLVCSTKPLFFKCPCANGLSLWPEDILEWIPDSNVRRQTWHQNLRNFTQNSISTFCFINGNKSLQRIVNILNMFSCYFMFCILKDEAYKQVWKLFTSHLFGMIRKVFQMSHIRTPFKLLTKQ